MDAYVITLEGNEYSERVARRCRSSAKEVGGIDASLYRAVTPKEVGELMSSLDLRWTWGKPPSGLAHHSYGGVEQARIACALSHYLLWGLCAKKGREFLILEHDSVFVSRFTPFEYENICQINDPKGATHRGDYWSREMAARGPGVWPKTPVCSNGRPDGLAGNSAYVIKPHAACRLMELVDEYGLWPNDAIMCKQFISLQEHYPFITEVRAEQSTI